ncbi:unnamed protein product [Calicophoron daubneyi]|uniref:Uncharacterized protein n=1 Tax=Calicophoron daubneyi TaxID=300641 RepID=A0AAV2U151_CALDB
MSLCSSHMRQFISATISPTEFIQNSVKNLQQNYHLPDVLFQTLDNNTAFTSDHRLVAVFHSYSHLSLLVPYRSDDNGSLSCVCVTLNMTRKELIYNKSS